MRLTGGRLRPASRNSSRDRDEAQFLGTLYTGMDLAANLEAARTSVHEALAVYGVPEEGEGSAHAR